jgi:hypothetical protein
MRVETKRVDAKRIEPTRGETKRKIPLYINLYSGIFIIENYHWELIGVVVYMIPDYI